MTNKFHKTTNIIYHPDLTTKSFHPNPSNKLPLLTIATKTSFQPPLKYILIPETIFDNSNPQQNNLNPSFSQYSITSTHNEYSIHSIDYTYLSTDTQPTQSWNTFALINDDLFNFDFRLYQILYLNSQYFLYPRTHHNMTKIHRQILHRFLQLVEFKN